VDGRAEELLLSSTIPLGATEMLVDFQHHYTPPELMETGKGDGSLRRI
jgi:hypothetical protein